MEIRADIVAGHEFIDRFFCAVAVTIIIEDNNPSGRHFRVELLKAEQHLFVPIAIDAQYRYCAYSRQSLWDRLFE